MSTDYILFIHGVNTRYERQVPTYADKLFQLIQQNVEPPLQLKKVSLYWGDVNIQAEKELLKQLKASKAWNQLWFQKFRSKQVLQFVGDAALYISSAGGSKVVEKLKQEALCGLANYNEQTDRLHLVTHSWGTVIIFDLLFAPRWEDGEIAGHQSVMEIRHAIFGLPPNSDKGICLASIHTLGAPIALFSLINLTGSSSRDLTSRFSQLMQNMQVIRGQKKLPWRNFIHPGDPVAWPLEEVIANLWDNNNAQYLDVEDIIVYKPDFLDLLTEPVSQTVLSLLQGGDAHASYLSSKEVAQKIAQTIQAERLTARQSYEL